MARWSMLAALLAGCARNCRIAPSDTAADGPTSDPEDTLDVVGACGAHDPDGWSPPVHTVVVLVPDGARVDETIGRLTSDITGEPTTEFWPEIRGQLYGGAVVVHPAYATGVTITAEGHAAMITGRRDPQATFPIDYGPGLYVPEYPTLLTAARRQLGLAEDQVVIVSNTVHLGGHVYSLYPADRDLPGTFEFLADEEGIPEDDDTVVIERVRQWMEEHDTRFVLANLHQIDRSAHYNTNDLAYPTNVKRVDDPIVQLWDWIRSTEPYADDTVLVVVADHGRHRWGEEDDWRNHGDHCAGCRQIPLVVLGPGVAKARVVEAAVTLEDLGATLAWLLGVELPLAEGRIACEILDNPPDEPSRGGTVAYRRSGTLEAWQEWLDDPWQHSRVVVDGEVLSDEGAVHAEAPVVVQGPDRDWACWRQLAFEAADDDVVETWPWTIECRSRAADGGEWEDVGFPLSPVQPYARPALAVDEGGRIWMAFADNPTGNWESPEMVLRVLRKTQKGAWEGADAGVSGMALPLYPDIVLMDGRAYVAVTTSDEQVDSAAKKRGRYSRHVEVWSLEWPAGGSQECTELLHTVTPIDGEGDTGATDEYPWGRMTRPRLAVVDGEVHVAFVAHRAGWGTTVLWAHSVGGGAFTDPEMLDDSGRVYGHVRPAWDGAGRAWWARMGEDGAVELCRAAPGGAPKCEGTAYVEVESLEGVESGVVATVTADGHTWEQVAVDF